MVIVTRDEFEKMLDRTASELTSRVRGSTAEHGSAAFAKLTRDVLARHVGIPLDSNPHPHIFPDIPVGEFGVEVKVTNKDGWRTIANSVFEGMRSEEVKHVYLMFGKMGGTPEVRWGNYGDSVVHVRTTHVPRFEVEIGAKESLFKQLGISYEEFALESEATKMEHIRDYARGRLNEGERLWWLDGEEGSSHFLPLESRLYRLLPQEEKRTLRAEATLLCPKVVGGRGLEGKYDDAAHFFLSYRGVLAPQMRDLFTAGSVGDKENKRYGALNILRATQDIEPEMRKAAKYLEPELFLEYWGESVPQSQRIKRWLELADSYATTWVPSKTLFLKLKRPRKPAKS